MNEIVQLRACGMIPTIKEKSFAIRHDRPRQQREQL